MKTSVETWKDIHINVSEVTGSERMSMGRELLMLYLLSSVVDILDEGPIDFYIYIENMTEYEV